VNHGSKGSGTETGQPSRSGRFENWARRVGYFVFQRSVAENLQRFRETFGFDLRLRAEPPAGRDGNEVAFWVSMPGWRPETLYVLYGRIVGERLVVALGRGAESAGGVLLSPYRELGTYDNLSELTDSDFSTWFGRLVRMHCDKI